MAVIKRMSSHATVGKVEKYLKQDKKTEEKLISGMNCNSDNFAKECQSTNLLYNKNKEKGERKYYHIVQSFSPEDNKYLSYEKAHKMAREFAEKNFKGHEVLIVTHKDTDHIHNHFIVNSINMENGKKYRADNKSLWQMREYSNELCKQNGLLHSIQDLKKKSKSKIKSGEVRKVLRDEEVWKVNLKLQIEETAKKAKTPEQFKKDMEEKFKVEVQERTRKSKGKVETIYEYKPEGNRKFCPENRLGTDYGKENIDGIIRRNEEKTRIEIARDTGTDTREKAVGVNSGELESEIRSRETEFVDIEIEQRKQELSKQDKVNQRVGAREQGAKDPHRKIISNEHER